MDKFFFFKSGQIYMKNAQCAETNANNFCDFYFLRYGHFYTQKLVNFWWILSTKTVISQKLQIRKWIFHSFQHIPHLSCKFGHFWRKKICPWIYQFGFKKWIPHALGLRTIAPLVSVNGIFRNSLFSVLHACIYQINFFFLQKWPNLHESCGMCWNEW